MADTKKSFIHVSLNQVPTPVDGTTIIGYDIDGILKQKNSLGVVSKIGGNLNPTTSYLPFNNNGTFSNSVLYQDSPSGLLYLTDGLRLASEDSVASIDFMYGNGVRLLHSSGSSVINSTNIVLTHGSAIKLNAPYYNFTGLTPSKIAILDPLSNLIAGSISESQILISITLGKTLFVDNVYGNDGTGLPYRMDKPYKTILAAQAVANSGELIYIMPGNYTDSNMGKNGVDYYFSPGAINTVTTYSFFANALSCRVFGRGKFIRNTTAGQAIISTANVGSIYLECQSLETSVSRSVFAQSSGDKIDVICHGDIINGYDSVFRVQAGAVMNIMCYGKVSYTASVFQCAGKLYVRAVGGLINDITSTYYAFDMSGVGNATVDADISFPLPTGWRPINLVATSILVINGNITATASSTNNLISVGSTSKLICNGIIKTIGDIVVAGEAEFNKTVESTRPIGSPAITQTGGKVTIRDYVINFTNDPAAHVISKSGGNLILKNAILVASGATANSIFAGSSQSVIIYNSFSNKSTDPNINQQVSSLVVDPYVI